MRARPASLLSVSRRFLGAERGSAVVDFALVLGLLTIPVLNAVDLALYAFDAMQTQNAAQMGAQAAFSNCDVADSLPASKNCHGANSANNMTLYDVVNSAITESSLGGAVKLVSAQVIEGYFCSSTADSLTSVGTTGYAYPDDIKNGAAGAAANAKDTAPSESSTTCGSSYADNTAAPGDYVIINVSYNYTPVFNASWLTVTSLLNPTITAKAVARLN